ALRRCAIALERQSHEHPPDHHFYFDGQKFELYTGTALAWLGDPAAEDYARHAAARFSTGKQPRRLATAYLDLGLVLARLGRPDEAAHCGVLALGANHLVPSNAWRADELIAAVAGYRVCQQPSGSHTSTHVGRIDPPVSADPFVADGHVAADRMPPQVQAAAVVITQARVAHVTWMCPCEWAIFIDARLMPPRLYRPAMVDNRAASFQEYG
ncbi:MAG: hypothetical protein WCE71_03145, partial [Pseudonocardiaceae bacterium]